MKKEKSGKSKSQKKKSLKQRCYDYVTQKDKKERIKAEKMKTLRKILIDENHDNKVVDKKRQDPFLSNKISTTKYNLLTFLPKSILAQFVRVSNIYFLVSAVLCSIPYFSPLPGYTLIAPLGLVLGISLLREAYEDYQEFLRTNAQKFQETQSNLRSDTKWADLSCGDLILLYDGEYFPADVALLMSSSQNGECFVQTASLDGERALKHKQCLAPVQHSIKKYGLSKLVAQIHTQQPTKNLYEFSGFIESEQFPQFGTVSIGAESKRRSARLDSKQLGLRGSNISNTDWVIGVVVFTGNDTKIMLNSGEPRQKQSRIEKTVNVICIYLIIIQAALCLLMSIFSGFFTSNNSKLAKGGNQKKAEYLFYSDLGATSSDQNTLNPGVEGVSTFGKYYILLNTIIPISLVVSIELVKFMQTPFFSWDLEMYDEQSMKHCTPISMTLHEELAQVKYVFADKTGTLTANEMEFKACSIGSVCYDEDYKEEDYDYIVVERDVQEDTLNIQTLRQLEESKEHLIDHMDIDIELNIDPKNKDQKESQNKARFQESSNPIAIIKDLLISNKHFLNEEIIFQNSFPSQQLIRIHSQNDFVHYFWLNIALCHDVIIVNDTKKNQSQYQGTSPDEITLLEAAKNIGYEFVDRTSSSVKVKIFGREITYTLLQKIEFNSDRKKMTVIVQDQETQNIILFTKGADLAILERLCDKTEQPFLEATQEDLIKFCTKGLRTLCLGMRVLDGEYYEQWANKYENSQLENIKLGQDKYKIEGQNAENMAERLEYEVESQLFLLGATALEDKLQDGVPEVIDDLHQAGIKVWMLTGDKLETAENIGFSSKMFNEKMFIFKLQTHNKNSTRQRLFDIESKMLQIEKQHSTPVIGTQFILNPNPHTASGMKSLNICSNPDSLNNTHSYEVRNIINALEEFKHESRHSENTLPESWARRPTFKRKLRKRLEEMIPDKTLIAEQLLRQHQIFAQYQGGMNKFIPNSFDMNMNQYVINQSNIYRSSQSASRLGLIKGLDYVDNEDDFAILVEGQSLQIIMDSKKMTKRFLAILAKCKAVVVCRASPSQKGLVVKMIQESEPDVVTLSIGDGANDVNMIQKAHIGVGIFGKEGYQAASSSDYAIGQFKFLRRLLFVHGRWSGIRLSFFMLFFFHKNIIFTLPQFWFGWYNGFSGQTFYDDNYLTVFNTIATSIAPMAFAVLEQDLNPNDETLKEVINLFYPQLYREAQATSLFSKYKFFAITCLSIGQSILVFGAPVIQAQNLLYDQGKDGDLWAAGTQAYFAVVFIHYLMILPVTSNWTWPLTILYIISFMVFTPIFVVPYNYLPNNMIQYRLWEIAFTDINFWLTQILIMACSIVPVKFYFWAQSQLFPSLKNLLLSKRLNIEKLLKQADPKKAKLSHELLKVKQQEKLQKWQQDYQQFDQFENQNFQDEQIQIEEGPQVEGDIKESNTKLPLDFDSPHNQSFSRKGLSPLRHHTVVGGFKDLKQSSDARLKLRRLRSENQHNEDSSKMRRMGYDQDDLDENFVMEFQGYSDNEEIKLEDRFERQIDNNYRNLNFPLSSLRLREESSENLEIETVNSDNKNLNEKYQTLKQLNDKNDEEHLKRKNLLKKQDSGHKLLLSSQRYEKNSQLQLSQEHLRSFSFIKHRQSTFNN